MIKIKLRKYGDPYYVCGNSLKMTIIFLTTSPLVQHGKCKRVTFNNKILKKSIPTSKFGIQV